jgi:predicted RNA binding protein YcfA (HicA-like mRNA interferase family)
MSKADKLLEKMRNNPRDWRIESLKTIASAHNIQWRQPGTSHVTFRHPNGNKLTVPAHRPIKPIYIKKFVSLIDEGIGD